MGLEQVGVGQGMLDDRRAGRAIPVSGRREVVGHHADVCAADLVLAQHHTDGPAFSRHPCRLEGREEMDLFLGVVPAVSIGADEVHPLPEGFGIKTLAATGRIAGGAKAGDHRKDRLVLGTKGCRCRHGASFCRDFPAVDEPAH